LPVRAEFRNYIRVDRAGILAQYDVYEGGLEEERILGNARLAEPPPRYAEKARLFLRMACEWIHGVIRCGGAAGGGMTEARGENAGKMRLTFPRFSGFLVP
jgi:hypothetical protein